MTSSHQYPEPIWVPRRDLRLGDVCQSAHGEAVLVGKEDKGSAENLLWRAANGEMIATVVTEEERDCMQALIRRGES
ncbi:hypothetical protein [Streptomyces sp. NPDC002215]|uniref:hypothetical protein n=1 Tax=Streptomyces sp. NPDC002215 TaxID=3154412 RepID=UPI00332D5FEB